MFGLTYEVFILKAYSVKTAMHFIYNNVYSQRETHAFYSMGFRPD